MVGRSQRTLDLIREYESRNVTYLDPEGSWPIVWERANNVQVWDADGKEYLDLTAAFGVASAGHSNLAVVRAGQKQMTRLLHAMGDVHPHPLKARLARELSRLTFERWAQEAQARGSKRQSHKGKTIFCNSGFEAVEAALKTALLASGKPGVIAFTGAYHGLGYGALNATHRPHFRSPFRTQLREFAHFVPFPNYRTDVAARGLARHASVREDSAGRRRKGSSVASGQYSEPDLNELEAQIRRLLVRQTIGAILVEPIQVRGGINIPPPGFLPMLRGLCDEFGVVLIFDEIYTGFGRSGKWFACEHVVVVPDLICLGKALTGGFPLSACVGRAEIMDVAWPLSTGEAIHTSTFLGHPVGCAMALAQIQEITRRNLVRRSSESGRFLLSLLESFGLPDSRFAVSVRGQGLLAGMEIWHSDARPATELVLGTIKAMLHLGFILLPEGEGSNVISFTPPLTISKVQLRTAVMALKRVLEEKSVHP